MSLIGPDPEPQIAPPAGTQVHAPNVTPAGGVSLTTSPATLFGPLLDTVIVYVVVPPGTAEATPSVFVTLRLTVPVAASVAVPCSGLVTPCVLAIAPGGIVLIRLPDTLARTVTASVQIAFALTLAPDSVTVVLLFTAVIVAPPHPAPVNVGAGGFATTMPAGRLSVNPTPVRLMAPALLLRIWIDATEVPPTATVVGLNDLLTVTDAAASTRLAFAAALVTPSVVVTALAAIVLVWVPSGPANGVATSSATVHDVFAAPPARLPPVIEKLVAPDVAVTDAPVHVVAAFAGAATTKPAPIVVRRSLKVMFVSADAPPVRVSVTVSRDLVPA